MPGLRCQVCNARLKEFQTTCPKCGADVEVDVDTVPVTKKGNRTVVAKNISRIREGFMEDRRLGRAISDLKESMEVLGESQDDTLQELITLVDDLLFSGGDAKRGVKGGSAVGFGGNPYSRPYIKRALQFIAKKVGAKDYYEALNVAGEKGYEVRKSRED